MGLAVLIAELITAAVFNIGGVGWGGGREGGGGGGGVVGGWRWWWGRG